MRHRWRLSPRHWFRIARASCGYMFYAVVLTWCTRDLCDSVSAVAFCVWLWLIFVDRKYVSEEWTLTAPTCEIILNFVENYSCNKCMHTSYRNFSMQMLCGGLAKAPNVSSKHHLAQNIMCMIIELWNAELSCVRMITSIPRLITRWRLELRPDSPQYMTNYYDRYKNISSYFICMNCCLNVLIPELANCNRNSSSFSYSRLRLWLPVYTFSRSREHRCAVMKTHKGRSWTCLCESHHSRWWFSYFEMQHGALRFVGAHNISTEIMWIRFGVSVQFEHRFYDCNFTAIAVPRIAWRVSQLWVCGCLCG